MVKLLTENLELQKVAYSEHSIAFQSMAGYVSAILAFVHAELYAREARSFCDF